MCSLCERKRSTVLHELLAAWLVELTRYWQLQLAAASSFKAALSDIT